MEGLFTRLIRMLDTVGYFQGSGRSHQIREVRELLHGTLTTRRQLRILEGIVRRLSHHRPEP
jgi:tRNA C32,U32 (ribose-2'-O)-methylase TrmJ